MTKRQLIKEIKKRYVNECRETISPAIDEFIKILAEEMINVLKKDL